MARPKLAAEAREQCLHCARHGVRREHFGCMGAASTVVLWPLPQDSTAKPETLYRSRGLLRRMQLASQLSCQATDVAHRREALPGVWRHNCCPKRSMGPSAAAREGGSLCIDLQCKSLLSPSSSGQLHARDWGKEGNVGDASLQQTESACGRLPTVGYCYRGGGKGLQPRPGSGRVAYRPVVLCFR
jgi:hypothetical protein